MPKMIHPADFKEVPWKNGKGFTREIYCIPHESNSNLFNFRLSLATVTESAPFSIFPDTDRFLMLLEGSGFRLIFEDQADAVLDSPFDSLDFEGEENIFCELLKGKCVDFNVMTNRSWGKSKVTSSLLKSGESKKITAKVETFVLLYGPSPLLIILGANEVYDIQASEHLVVIEISLTRKHFH